MNWTDDMDEQEDPITPTSTTSSSLSSAASTSTTISTPLTSTSLSDETDSTNERDWTSRTSCHIEKGECHDCAVEQSEELSTSPTAPLSPLSPLSPFLTAPAPTYLATGLEAETKSNNIREKDEKEQQQQQQREPRLKITSCLQCTLLGLKCDLKLPSCTRCQRRRDKLEYPPILPPSSSSSSSLSSSYSCCYPGAARRAEDEEAMLIRQKCIPLRERTITEQFALARSNVVPSCRMERESIEVRDISAHGDVKKYIHSQIEAKTLRQRRWMDRVALLSYHPAPLISSSSSSSSSSPLSSPLSQQSPWSHTVDTSVSPQTKLEHEKRSGESKDRKGVSPVIGSKAVAVHDELFEQIIQRHDSNRAETGDARIWKTVVAMQQRKSDYENWILPHPLTTVPQQQKQLQ